MTDPLSDILSLLRVDSALSARLEARGLWSLSFPARHQILFGIVLEGSMYLTMDGLSSIRLETGDCYLLSWENAYRLSSGPRARSENGPQAIASNRGQDGIVRFGKGELNLVLAGGTFRLEADSSNLFLNLLPPIIHLPSGSLARTPLRAAFNLIASETEDLQPGAGAIAGGLASLILVQILRVYIKSAMPPVGWLGAIADHHIGNSLAAMHSDYARQWTVEDLATEVGMSRTAFAVRFRTLVGMPPLEYLREWRMTVARRDLKAGKSLSSVAESVGYASDTAFNAAFKRSVGQSPGRYKSDY